MKNVLLGIGIGVAGTVLFGLGWFSHGWATKASVAAPYAGSAPQANAAIGNSAANPLPPAPAAPFITRSDFDRLRAARDAALQSNPDLQAEYKEIISAMDAEQKELDAEMVKADPKLAPIVAKLVALREQNGAHTAAETLGPR